jgi:hypothetical protein
VSDNRIPIRTRNFERAFRKVNIDVLSEVFAEVILLLIGFQAVRKLLETRKRKQLGLCLCDIFVHDDTLLEDRGDTFLCNSSGRMICVSVFSNSCPVVDLNQGIRLRIRDLVEAELT